MPQDVAELVAAAKHGDREAFDELVRATYADTYTLAYRLTGNEEDARDVVQEAYLRAFRGLRRFRGDAQFSTWMYRITANCAATQLGKRARHRHDELQSPIPASTTIRSSGPTPTTSGADSTPPWTPCRRGCARSSSCATSTSCRTSRLRPSSASLSRRPRCASTGRATSCATSCSPGVTGRPPVRCEPTPAGEPARGLGPGGGRRAV